VSHLICIYCEGTDTKIAVVTKENEKIKVHRVASFDMIQPSIDLEEGITNISIEGDDFKIESMDAESAASVSTPSLMNSELQGLPLKKSLFLPAVTEPAIYYHIFEAQHEGKRGKVLQEIITDIHSTKNIYVDKDSIDYIELDDKSILAVFLSGELNCVKMINSLARFNGRRYFKIPTIKSAEISLAYYVAKRKKFFPDDYSLIVYIGKEYSKLVFLHGRKLKHIGSTLDIGTVNLHTYDVYFSKILLEMENGGISSLDNIVVCGEDDSENLILSFYGTFPEANVTRLEFDDLDISAIRGDDLEKISSYSVPFAVANDYFDEKIEEHESINLLPKYVKEEQKMFQFSWHGYALLPFLFLATLYFTLMILSGNREIRELDEQITTQTILLRQNEERLRQIADLETKISGFDQTQAILDMAAVGSGVWSEVLTHLSSFISARKNIWLTRLSSEGTGGRVVLEGYALTKNVLTDLAYSLETAELRGVFFEEIRERNSYKFTITFNLSSYIQTTE
jgi:hypothetical protein